MVEFHKLSFLLDLLDLHSMLADSCHSCDHSEFGLPNGQRFVVLFQALLTAFVISRNISQLQ